MVVKQALSLLLLFAILVVADGRAKRTQRYTPDWKSLDSRPLPPWFDEAKLGIFMHWGVYSVQSYANEWFWHCWKSGTPYCVNFMKENYRPGFTYADFASQFTAEFFNATQWAEILASSGAKYVVLTSKHHEGFTNWPSKYSFNWNSMDVGPGRDLVGELANATRKLNKMRFGLYHSLIEWFNPVFLKDLENNLETQEFVRDKVMPCLHEIVNNYRPDVVWSDGDWNGTDTYWNSTHFIAWLYNDSPVKETVVTNDRWGVGIPCHHGGYFTCHDRYNPGVLQPRKWENSLNIDKGSYGFRRTAHVQDYLSMDELLEIFVETVSCGGNLLMNVGPTADGRIVPIFQERLQQMGEWLKVNGEAIYFSKPWLHQNDTLTKGIWYTAKNNTNNSRTDVFALVLDWPRDNTVQLGAPISTTDTKAELLGFGDVPWKVMNSVTKRGIVIDLNMLMANQVPCDWAWTFKLTNLKQQRENRLH